MVGLREGTEYHALMHVALSTDRAGVDAFYEAALAALEAPGTPAIQRPARHRTPRIAHEPKRATSGARRAAADRVS
jgi:hypothetical protein